MYLPVHDSMCLQRKPNDTHRKDWSHEVCSLAAPEDSAAKLQRNRRKFRAAYYPVGVLIVRGLANCFCASYWNLMEYRGLPSFSRQQGKGSAMEGVEGAVKLRSLQCCGATMVMKTDPVAREADKIPACLAACQQSGLQLSAGAAMRISQSEAYLQDPSHHHLHLPHLH